MKYKLTEFKNLERDEGYCIILSDLTYWVKYLGQHCAPHSVKNFALCDKCSKSFINEYLNKR